MGGRTQTDLDRRTASKSLRKGSLPNVWEVDPLLFK